MANIPLFNQAQNRTIYDTQLNQSLQESISDNGLVAPSQPTTAITQLATQMPNGTIWYDETTHQLKALVNGSVIVL